MKLRQVLPVGVLMLVAAGSAAAAARAPDVNFMPKSGYAATVTGTRYVEPSATRVLQPGEKISRLTERNKAGDVIVQKLTERSYWVQTGFYNTVFYVGDQGVLLMDPLGDGQGAAVRKAISGVSRLPVTAVLYSHNHADHIGDVQVFVDEAKVAGRPLRIVTSDATANKQRALQSTLPAATDVVPFAGGTFRFESLTVKALGFTRAAHTDDSAAWLMVEEAILHAPDMVNPDQMPYLGFGGSENAVYLTTNLDQLAQAEWKLLSGGHGNVGGKADITFMQTYVADLEAAVGRALKAVDTGRYFNARMNNHQSAAHRWSEAVAKQATKALRAKYGRFYGFEASVPHQAHMMIEALSSYR